MSEKRSDLNHNHQHPFQNQQSILSQEKAQFSDIEKKHEKKPEQVPVEVPHPNPAENFVDKSRSLKRVQSGEEIIPARNVESNSNDKRNSGIVIRIKSLEEVGYLPAKVLIEIRNETNPNRVDREDARARQTKLVPKDNPIWDEDFYYNNNVVLDDNITFILFGEGQKQLAKTEVRNLSLLRKENQQKQQLDDSQIERQLVKLDLKKESSLIAKLVIQISFYQREDILGGVLMPVLSLRPPADFVAKYNAIDSYKPQFENKPGSRANCFNFYDAGMLPGFDNVEVFPPKIQRRNKKVIIEVE